MAELEKLNIQITADTKQAEKNLSTFESQANKLGSTLKGLKGITGGLNFNNIGAAASSGFKAVNAEVGKLDATMKKVSASTQEVKGNIDKISANSLSASGKKVNQELSKATNNLKAIKAAASGTKNVFNSLFGGITSKLQYLTHMVTRRVMYRAINAVISLITQGFRDGTNAMYQYSKAIDGKFAKSMDSLASSVNYLKGSLGAMVAPLITAIQPVIEKVINKFVEWLDVINQIFARLSGASTWTKAVRVETEYAEATDKATKANEKLKKSFIGLDQINALSDNSKSSSSASSKADPMAGYKFEEVPIDTAKIDGIIDKLKTIKDWAEKIAVAIAAWKISKALLGGIEAIKNLKDQKFSWGFALTGVATFLDGWSKLKEAIDEIKENGLTFENGAKAISGGLEIIASALLIMGEAQLGGVFLALEAIAGFLSAVADMAKNGINFDNATTALKEIAMFVAAIGLVTKNAELAGWSLIAAGILTIINNIKDVWNAIKTGDWSGVDKAAVLSGVIYTVAGIIVAYGKFSKLAKSVKGASEASSALSKVGEATDSVNQATGALSTKLVSLAKNLALGLVIIAEVAVAAGLIVGAIWGLGVLLEQVGKAWEPVIANGGTIIIAVGIGVGVLATIGTVTAKLGSIGTTLVAKLGIGIAMLALIGVSAGLFIAEIWGIGVGLNKIGEAWQPVFDNKDTIIKGIVIGSVILLGIGAAIAGLGVLTVASVGLLPIAIGLGTAMLIELGAATVAFIASLVKVANSLGNDLYPALRDLNTKLPTLAKDMENFTTYMGQFAGNVVAYTASSAIAGFASAVDKVIKFFTKDPIKSLTDDVKKQHKQINPLISTLNEVNPKFNTANTLLNVYYGFLQRLENITKIAGNISFSNSSFTKISNQIKAIPSQIEKHREHIGALIEKLEKANPEFKTATDLITTYYTFLQKLEAITKITNNISLAKGMFVSMKEVGKNLVLGFVDGIKSNYNSISVAVKDVLSKALSSSVANSYGRTFGQQLASGVSSGFKSGYFPTLRGNVNVAKSGSVALQLRAFAQGGIVDAGQLFIARERGAELVGNIGGQTAVMNNDQIVESVSTGVARANDTSNALLRELIRIGNELLDKPSDTIITTSQITDAFTRMNRRAGQTVIATGR